MPHHTATCSCGQLRITLSADPLRVSMCHCLACQRRTGSVFGVQARFAAGAARIEGDARTWSRTGDEGGVATFHFCPVCGATVFYRFDADDSVVAVPVGGFADPGFAAPTRSVYGARRHPWVVVPPGVTEVWD